MSHVLVLDEALRRVKGLPDQLEQEFSDHFTGLRQSWDGSVGTFCFDAKGLTITFEVKVNASVVAVDARIPFAIRLFQSRIREEVEKVLTKLLNG